MRLLLLVFLVSFSLSVGAQKADTLRRYLNEELAFASKNNSAYPAIAVATGDHWYMLAVYPDTSSLIKAYFKDRALSIKDGPFTLFFPKGKKAMEGIYTNNLKQGIWKYWYKNGQLKDSGMFKNNAMVNTWYSWYENGQLMSVGHYPGEKDIPFTNPPSTEKGKGIFASDYVINEKDGPWFSYYENGKLKDSGDYIQNVKEGLWTSWHENGQLESRGKYHVNDPIEEWVFYHENGQPSTHETYKNGKVVAMECFDTEGKSTGSFCSLLKAPEPILERFVDFRTYMLDHLFWPKELEGKDVNGIVKISYTISKEGKMTDFKILQTPHELLGKETERFFRTLEKWSPAISHNRVIDFTVLLEIPFYR